MTLHSAFEEIDRQPVPDYKGEGLLLRHRQSGAQLFHLHNEDPENMFAFAFATYPQDSTGVAHILEHTVLSGSERFPVKDPFLQLLKGSVNTFLNAMTYPDKTVYPAASPVSRDLFNMMKVYGDAVFFPLLKPELFRQEGHRLEFDEDGRLIITGIVYNEMKGNYSSHDSIVGETCFQSLLPDTIYGFDSGGDPAAIPQLSYEQFVAFHQRFYHPSNARIMLYGNVPTGEYLDFLHEEFLSRFSSAPEIAQPVRQPRWSAPRRVEETYPLDEAEDTAERSSVTMNWLLFPVRDARRVVDAAVLSEILLGHSGSPLARALLESGLGQDLSPVVGLETDLQEAVFSAGLRGTEPEHEEAIRSTILDTLRQLSTEGIDPDTIEGALRRFEFSNREIKGGPNGMRAMRRALRGWMYGGLPYDGLAFEAHFEALRADLAANPRFFESLIRELLLENNHRSTVVVRPEPGKASREARELEVELAQRSAALGEEERRRIEQSYDALRAMQETPDRPEDLAKIPFLTLEDVPREVQTVEHERGSLADAGELFVHRAFTNGIVYLDLAFDMGRLSQREELLLNLLGAAFTEVGLPGLPHHRLNDEINLRTGGITAFVSHQTRYGNLETMRRLLILRVRVLERSWQEGVDLLARIIAELDFSDHHRLEQLIDELVQEMQSALIPSGHYFSGLRAASQLHPLMSIEERLNGLSQLEALRGFAADPAAVAAELRELFTRLIDPAVMHANVTADAAVADDVVAWLPHLRSRVAERHAGAGQSADEWARAGAVPSPRPEVWEPRSFMLASATVSYVAHVLTGARFGDEDAAAQDLLAHIMRTGPLWEKIRMQGGAYGAFASSRTTEGLFSFGSYRDPHTVRTLTAYREALAAMAAAPPEKSQMDLAKVSVLGRELKPLTPRDSAFTNFRRRLHDIDDPLRQETRDRLRAVDPGDLQRVAARLLESFDQGRTVVLGGQSGLEELQSALGELPTVRTGV